MIRQKSGVLAAVLALCVGWPGTTSALETLFLIAGRQDSERVTGAVREMAISTEEYVSTVRFSPAGLLREKIRRDRDDLASERVERVIYRYDDGGRISGEFVQDPDGDIPVRLYAYKGERLAGEAAYHLCRTFSTLHLYAYDAAGRVIEDLQYESRRLWRRVLLYDEGRLQGMRTFRNGMLLSEARYRFDEAGRVTTVILERGQPDRPETVTTTHQYDAQGNPFITIERNSIDASQDKIEIAAHEYDAQGNWIRRTVIRAVNPLDADQQPLERPVEVTTRAIVYW